MIVLIVEKVDTNLCNIGGMTCDEGTELSYAFDSVRLHMQNVPWARIFKLLYIVYQSGYSCVF